MVAVSSRLSPGMAIVHLAYYDQSRPGRQSVQRVLIGRPWQTADILRDGLYVRDHTGKDILTATGLGVQIADENQIRGGSTSNVHSFPNTVDIGFWSAPSTHGIPNRTVWNLSMVSDAPNYVTLFIYFRFVINNSIVGAQWDRGAPVPQSVVVDIPANQFTTATIQGYMVYADGSQRWEAYNTVAFGANCWHPDLRAKTRWTVLELKR